MKILLNFSTKFFHGLLLGAVCVSSVLKLVASPDSATVQIANSRLFPQPLVWIGVQPPLEDESKTLLTDIEEFKNKSVATGFSALEQFVSKHPDSAWTPALNVNLAEYYRAHGRYSLALTHWEAAWNVVKNDKNPEAQQLAVRTVAGWTRLLATLGQKDKLNTLFKQIDSLQLPYGTYGIQVQETREGLGVMNARPGVSYRCGSYALGHVAAELHMDPQICRQLYEKDSPDGGFHMDELLALAKTNGMDMVAVRAPKGSALVLPCVVHWKLNHYAAILREQNGRYLVEDPTFGGSTWMDADSIKAEASGDFLVPRDKVPADWRRLTSAECASIYGKGAGNQIDDGDDDGPSGCNPPGGDGEQDMDDSNCDPPTSNDGSTNQDDVPTPPTCPCGMPQWYVSEPYMTVWLVDIPLRYRQSNGQWMQLRLAYKSAGLAATPNASSFGPDWSCNWLGMLVDSGIATVTNYLAGGGIASFASDGTPEYKTARTYIPHWAGISSYGPALITPFGAANHYDNSIVTGLAVTDYYLTKRSDRYGRQLQRMDYTGAPSDALLSDVVDIDGQTNWIGETNFSSEWAITSVTNPYNISAHFTYSGAGSTAGLLTNITDAQGLQTSFQYDSSDRITNMVTPYGTTSFQYYSSNDVFGFMERALLVTEANGDHQLYVYRDQPPTNNVFPYIEYPGDGYESVRMSFHWNRRQYETIAADWQAYGFDMPVTDYQEASVKHWLHGYGGSTSIVSDTLDSSSDPYDPVLGTKPNCISYTYYGENPPYIGTLKRVTTMSINNQLAIAADENPLGRPTYFLYIGSPGLAWYYNNFDSSGTILQSETGPRGELTRGYGYDPVIPNLLTSVTNAVGDVIKYTHDPTSLEVTSITFPGGLVRTNVYYSSGPNKGFLAMQADIGFKTNYFAYTNGNLFVETNELGLVTTYNYDNLNRNISTTFPDGTTISNVYNNLDLVATKDRLNQWTYYGYNSVRQLMAFTNVDGQVTTYGYCSCGSPDEITNWNGTTPLVTSLSYDLIGRLANATYPDGYQLSYAYDANDRVQTVTDGANDLGLSYDLVGTVNHISGAVLGGQLLLTNQFDEYGRITNSVDRNNIATAISYDYLNRLTTRQNFGYDGNFTGQEEFFYSALGLTNYVDELGHVTAYVRDSESRILYETNANNEVLQFSYNPAGQLQSLTDGKGQATKWNYDQYGRTTNKIDNASITNFVYEYDPLGRLTNRWTPAKGTTVYRYDPVGNLTNVDYSLGAVYTPSINFAYDGLNRLTSMVDGVGTNTFGWTDGNQLQSEAGPWTNDTVSYEYSARLRSTMALSQPNGPNWVQNYGYDPVMRLSTVISPGGSTSLSSPAGSFTYEYTGGSDLVQGIQFPAVPSGGSVYITNLYDSLGHLTNTYLSSPLANVADEHSYSYDMGSEVTQQVFTAGNLINYTYDNIGQLLTAQGQESSGTARLQEQFGYAYDKAWNLNYRTNNALVLNFSVNNINELSGASRNGTFTVAGDTTELPGSVTGTPPGVTNVTVNGSTADLYADGSFAATGFSTSPGTHIFTAIGKDTYGRQSTSTTTAYFTPSSPSYSFDLNGNLTSDGSRNFGYDVENELVAVWVAGAWSNNFAYDGLQRRRIEQEFSWNGSSWLKTNEVHFVYDGNLVVQERNQNNSPLTTYTRGIDLSGTLQGAGGIGGLLARSDSELVAPSIFFGGNASYQYLVNSYFHNDGNGNVTALIEPSGFQVANYEYDPYGNMISMSGLLASANKYRFSSKEWSDNAGLYYYLYRFYDPNLQRWLNRDPLGDFASLTYLAPSLEQEDEADDSASMADDEFLSAWTQANQNLFGSIGNNPINTFDAFGLCDDSVSASAKNPDAVGQIARDTIKEAKDGQEAEAAAQKKAAEEAAEKKAAQVASEKMAKAMANRIEKDLGKEARREFHDAQRLRDRTGQELKQDAKALYDEYYPKTGKTCPSWMSP